MKLQGSGTSAPKTLQFQTHPHSQIATYNQPLRRCSRTTKNPRPKPGVPFSEGALLLLAALLAALSGFLVRLLDRLSSVSCLKKPRRWRGLGRLA